MKILLNKAWLEYTLCKNLKPKPSEEEIIKFDILVDENLDKGMMLLEAKKNGLHKNV